MLWFGGWYLDNPLGGSVLLPQNPRRLLVGGGPIGCCMLLVLPHNLVVVIQAGLSQIGRVLGWYLALNEGMFFKEC